MSVKSYGEFSPDGKEFVIHTPHTPRPWINYLSNGDFCSLVSHVGGGFSFHLDHRVNGVLRRELRCFTDDLPARLWYVQEKDGRFWTANGYPTARFGSFEARHGFGYTRVSTTHGRTACQIEWFVAPGLDGEFASFTIRNTSRRWRSYRIFSFQEFIIGNSLQDQHERAAMHLFQNAERVGNTLYLENIRWSTGDWASANQVWPLRAYVTTDTKPVGLTGERADFVGYMHTLAEPKTLLEQSNLGSFEKVRGVDPAGVFQWNVELGPGEERTIHLLTGVVQREQYAPQVDAALVQQKRRECNEFWDGMMSPLTVQTPDRELNIFVNYWNKYQLMINNWFGRGPSYFHKGQYPAMRDCCQDSFGALPLIPVQTREKLLRVFSFMFSDGRVGAGCNRVTYCEEPTDKADLALWMVMATRLYVQETGDATILDEVLPFLDGGSSTLYEHLKVGVQRVIDQRGEHGIPLIWNGDWNDALDRIGEEGRGESIWLAQFLCYTLGEFEHLIALKGDRELSERYKGIAAELKTNLEACHWDGEWFLRAFDDDGRKVGSKENEEAFIYLNSQTWAIISGTGTPQQHEQALAAVDKYLETDYGLVNLHPAYSRPDPKVGIISRFIPGHKENGAVFSHATAFHLVARAMMGDAEGLYRLYRKSLPGWRDQESYKAEPYVYCQYCAGPASTRYGEGAYHWLTGTAAWMLRVVADYMLGVRPTDDGLTVQPCVPPSFTEYRIKRTFRGAAYHVHILNPEGKSTGVASITIDGKPLSGNLIPIQPRGSECNVEVRM